MAGTGGKGKVSRRVLMVVGALLLVAAGFGAGYLVFRARSTNYYGVTVATENEQTKQSATELAQRVEEVSILLADESYDPASIDTATSATIQALLKANGDEYARYYTADQYRSYIDKTSGEYAGIGVLLSEYEGSAYVVHVYPGSPAQAAGLQEGDFITTIDGVTKVSWGLEEVTSLITAKEGETVDLGWRRPTTRGDAGGQTYQATIQCANMEVPNVSYALRADGVGYISIAQFTTDVTDEVKAAITDLDTQGATGYVLDLRGNPGGYITQAIEVASCFLKSGVVVGVQARDSDVSYRSVTDDHLTDKPLVVLVNQDTASVSEVVAAALQSSGRAKVVGTVTFGKGTVQAYKELTFGGAIKYTIAHYLTPNGTEIDGVGITPDIEVDMDIAAIGGDADVQYQAAAENVMEQVSAAAAAAATDTTTATVDTTGTAGATDTSETAATDAAATSTTETDDAQTTT